MTLLATAVPPAPGVAQTWIPTVLSTVVALIVGYMVYRNARKANAITEESKLAERQLAWTQQAMSEATAAKIEARGASEAAGHAERAAKAATDAADAANRRAEGAERRLTEVTELTDRLMDWIVRVVRKAHVDGIGTDASPQVEELLRTINGGPPEVSLTRLNRRR